VQLNKSTKVQCTERSSKQRTKGPCSRG